MNKIKDIFDHTTDNVTPEMGRLLVAEPLMSDPYFSRAVVAPVTVSAEDGVMGLVLGNRSEHVLSDCFDNVFRGDEVPVYTGGPMSPDHLFVLHTLGKAFEREARPLGNGLWLSANIKEVILAVETAVFPPESFRFFIGYSGWKPGQLEKEIRENSWAVTEPDALSGQKLLSTDENRQWKYALGAFGDRYRHWLLYPRLPFSN